MGSEAESWGRWKSGNFAHLCVSRTFLEMETSCITSHFCSEIHRMTVVQPYFSSPPEGRHYLSNLTVISCLWSHTGKTPVSPGPTSVPPSALTPPASLLTCRGPALHCPPFLLHCSLWTISPVSTASSGTHIEILATLGFTSASQKFLLSSRLVQATVY